MELNLFTLRVFLKVVEYDGISNAAKALLLSQPAVSVQIQNLESYLSTQLFLRKPTGKMVLTEAGKNLHVFAEKIVDLSGDLLLSMEKYTHKPLSGIRLGVCFTAGRYLVPDILDEFKKKNQSISGSLTLTVTRAVKVFEDIAGGKLDMGIVGRRFKKQLFTETQLIRMPLTIFMVTNGSGLPNELSLKELMTIPLIAREEGAGCRYQFQEFLAKKKVNIHNFKIFAESESIDSIKNLVKSGYGFSVLPEFMIKKEIEDGFFSRIKLKEGQPLQTFYIYYLKKHRLSRTQQDFLDHVLESAGKLQNALLASADEDHPASSGLLTP